MDTVLTGFVTLGTFIVALGMLIVALFAWLRQDIRELHGRFDVLRDKLSKLSERVARIEGLLEAVFMRRDLTPFPEPPPPESPPDKSKAA